MNSPRDFLKFAFHAIALVLLPLHLLAGAWQPAPKDYKCLYNFELLVACGREKDRAAYIASLIEKLRDTDVDAVMCCPTAWRTNLFPSRVDPIGKNYQPGQLSPKFPGFASIMSYIHGGGDPVKETLEACRRAKKSFFISYRMNDHHYVTDKTWPTHNAIWREHPEYWMGDSDDNPYSGSDNIRIFNYMRPEVRDYYYDIIHELCTNYDVDGVELDFQRYPKFFRRENLAEGRGIMTAFVRRIRTMLDTIGRERGKVLQLSIRIPETLAKCDRAGLEVLEWDREGLVDLVNVSSFYTHTIELGVEEFRAGLKRAKLYGEMNYVTRQVVRPEGGSYRRYTTPEIYRASALNLLARGADGISLFNYDYIPAEQRGPMAGVLRGITDIKTLNGLSKSYAIYAGFGTFPARDRKAINLMVADNPIPGNLNHALLRIETKQSCADLKVQVSLNGKNLVQVSHNGTELFQALDKNLSYPQQDTVKFYAVPLDLLRTGSNQIEIENRDAAQKSCEFISLELALFY